MTPTDDLLPIADQHFSMSGLDLEISCTDEVINFSTFPQQTSVARVQRHTKNGSSFSMGGFQK
jgi:hypothetical protein